MRYSRDIRRAALQTLYQLDARNDEENTFDIIRQSLEGSAGEKDDHEAGFDLGVAAWNEREIADQIVAELTPQWPTHRQPIIDRSLLRLAYYEMTKTDTPPKVAINEAIELAREYSTEKSPSFINGVLDKIHRQLREAAATDS